MPEIVPDDGARDPIVRREQQPTTCTEGNDSTRGTSRVRFDETTHKLGGPKAFQRSFSEDPSAFYKRNCDSGARPFHDFCTDCDNEGEGEEATNKTIETQTSLQETTENEKLMLKFDDIDCEKCGDSDKHGLKIRRQISIKAERRCKLLTILFFIIVFLLMGALIVAFLVLRPTDGGPPPTAGAQTQSNASESEGSHTCPSFIAEIKTDELKNSNIEFSLPWRRKQADSVSYLHMMDRDKLVIQKATTYTVHANVHIDTKSWAEANDKKSYSATMCITVTRDESPFDDSCSELTISTRNVLPLNVHMSRLSLQVNDIVQVYMQVKRIDMISDGRIELHPEKC